MSSATLEPETEPAQVAPLPFVDWPRFFTPSDHHRAEITKQSIRFEWMDATEETFQADVGKLVGETLDQPFREVGEGCKQWKKAIKLREQADDLWLAKCSVKHERPLLMFELRPDFLAALGTAQEVCERRLVDDVNDMKGMGLGDAFPEAQANAEGIDMRLRALAAAKEWNMAARGDVNRSQQALEHLDTLIYLFPQESDCAVAWPTFTGLAGEVARLLNLVPAGPRPTLLQRLTADDATADKAKRNHRSLKLERLLRETDLELVAMLPAHEQALEALIGLIDDYDGNPLQQTKETLIPQARELVKRLPQTRMLRIWLNDTKAASLTRE
jgi:hypothetical protein